MTIIPFEAFEQARVRREQAKLPPPPPPMMEDGEDIALRIARSLEELKAEMVGLRADLRSFERRLTLRFAGMLAVSTLISVVMTVWMLSPGGTP